MLCAMIEDARATGPTVTVLGEASVRVRPDQAQIQLEVVKVERRSEDAHRDVAVRSERLEALLEELRVPKDKRTTTGVSVAPEQSWSGSRWERKGWRAANRIVDRLEDAAIAGRLIADAVDRAEATVGGPWWVVTPANPARMEACSQAALQARGKAQAYAAAVGLRLGAVTEIREPGTGRSDRSAVQTFAASASVAMAARGGGEQAPTQIDVDPGELDVFGSVEVTFALES
jgi:uncharacterized protein